MYSSMTVREISSAGRMRDRLKILVLGGTGDAVAMATEAAEKFDITYSLAGRTSHPALPDGVTIRTGGFGGPHALADWLGENNIGAVIDATHPFAERIAAHTAQACSATHTPRLKLTRPAWDETADDTWHRVPDIAAAASLLPTLGARAFLSIGRQELGAFAAMEGVQLLIRSIDLPGNTDRLPRAVYITGRGPFTTAQESALLREHDINVLVSKNAGGAATYAKIAAARMADVPVVMIDRPTAPPNPIVSDVGAAITWLETRLG